MRRSRFLTVLSTACTAVLAAAVVVAAGRVPAGHEADQPESPKLTLRFIDQPADGNPFAVEPGGPDAPPPPLLPGERAGGTQVRSAGVATAAAIPAEHLAASENDVDPASRSWALIIGLNDYAGGTRDNIGSYQDAVALRAHLLSLGWLPDHVLLIGNRAGTKAMVQKGLAWLASKTSPRSTVVFHYSGHEKPYRTDVDRDGERRDVALWLSDNKLMSDAELGRALGRVRAGRMWLNFAVCRAGGFDDPGTGGANRIITYSSPEAELSYEDPVVKHSVFGYNVIVRGMLQGKADADGDGAVSVEEAFHYARPYVVQRTEGHQHPVLEDRYEGDFDLRIYAV